MFSQVEVASAKMIIKKCCNYRNCILISESRVSSGFLRVVIDC